MAAPQRPGTGGTAARFTAPAPAGGPRAPPACQCCTAGAAGVSVWHGPPAARHRHGGTLASESLTLARLTLYMASSWRCPFDALSSGVRGRGQGRSPRVRPGRMVRAYVAVQSAAPRAGS